MKNNILKYFLIILMVIQALTACKNPRTEKVTTPASVTEVVIKEPETASDYYKRAQEDINKKDFKNAFIDVRKAIELDSNQASYYALLGDLHFSFNQIIDAKVAFEKCIRMEGSKKESLLKLGQVFFYLKEYKKSLENLDQVLKIDVHNAQAYFLKGMNFKEMNDTAKALSSFQTTIEQAPDYYAAYIQLGLMYAKGKNKLAAEYYNTAIRLEPKSAEAYYNLAMFYQENYDIDAAMKYYNELTQFDPGYKNAWFNLGYIHHIYKKKYKEAIRYYSYALRIDTGYTEARNNRELVYELLKKETIDHSSLKTSQ